MTIRRKTLFWFLIPSVLITVATALSCYNYTRKAFEKNIFEQLETAANELRQHTEVLLEAKRGRVIDFSSDGLIRECAEEINMKEGRRRYHIFSLITHLAKNKKPIDKTICEILVLNRDGKVIASTEESHIGTDVSGKEYYASAKPFEVFVSDPYFDKDLNKILIDFSTILLNRDGQEPVGVIVNRIEYEQQEEMKRESVPTLQNYGENLPVFTAVNRTRIMDFSSDGFIRSCTESIIKRVDTQKQYARRLNDHLVNNKKSLDPEIIEVFVVNLAGEVTASTEPGRIGTNISEDVFFSKAAKENTGISDLHFSSYFGQNTFEVSSLISGTAGGDPIGIIVNRYSGDILNKLTFGSSSEGYTDAERENGLGKTGELYIVNSDRLMITGSRFMQNAVLRQVVNTEGVRHAFDNRAGTMCVYPDYRGILTLGVSKYYEEMDWVLLAEKDLTEAFAPVVWLRYLFAIMGVAGILIMVIISLFMSAGITKSIKKLIKGTKRIADGDLGQPIKIDTMDGEMKELGESFNFMMRELSKSIHENRTLFFQVKKGRDEWQHTFDAITDMITIQDRNHNIIMANKAFYDKFNIGGYELDGLKCYNVFHGVDAGPDCCLIEDCNNTLDVKTRIVNNQHLGGIFLESIYPLRDEGGGFYAYVHIVKDITLQNELQSELLIKARELERANKELEDFIYLTSHDLKEPLFVIGGFTSRLSMAYNDVLDEKGRRFIRRIKANVEKMNNRIYEIMEVLKAGSVEYKFKDNDSAIMVENAISTLKDRVRENRITIAIKDNLPPVYCDEARMKDVFVNLLSNAIKFMGNDKLSGATPQPNDEGDLKGRSSDITIGCEEEGEFFKFFVEDTGIGIHRDYQAQIFKMFKRLNDLDVEGSGVGLAIVKKIVEHHNGNIWVESPVRNGKGSRFCFTIPRNGKAGPVSPADTD